MANRTLLALYILTLGGCGVTPQSAIEGGESLLSDGNNGNFAYYGITADGGPLTSATPPGGPSAVSLDKAFYLNFRDLDERYLDAAIYHPTCLTNHDPSENYSLVLMSPSPAAPTALGISVRPLSIDYSYRSVEVGAANFTGEAWVADSSDHLLASCVKGKRTAPGFGTLYSNGALAIFQSISGDVYFGLRSGWIPDPVSSTAALYSEYFQNYHFGSACGIGSPCSSAAAVAPRGGRQSNFSAYDQVNPATGPAGAPGNFVGAGQIFNTEIDRLANWSFHVLKASAGETAVRSSFIAADGTVNGKRVLIAAQPTGTDSDTAPTYILGAGAVYLRLED